MLPLDHSPLLRWMERSFLLTLILSILLKLFHPLLAFPLSFSAVLFKLSAALLFFYYMSWPWSVASPTEEKGAWPRMLHFGAPLLWAFNFLLIFVARTWIRAMEQESAEFVFNTLLPFFAVVVIAIGVKQLADAATKAATRHYRGILLRTFLIGALSQYVIGS